MYNFNTIWKVEIRWIYLTYVKCASPVLDKNRHIRGTFSLIYFLFSIHCFVYRLSCAHALC